MYVFTQRCPLLYFLPPLECRISGKHSVGWWRWEEEFEFRRPVEPPGGTSRRFIMPYYRAVITWAARTCGVCAYPLHHPASLPSSLPSPRPTDLVHISLGGPLFAQALLLHCLGVVDLLGFVQGLGGGLDVLHGLQRGRNLFFRLPGHTHTYK